MLQASYLHSDKHSNRREVMTTLDTGVRKSTAETLRDLIHSQPAGQVLIRDPKDLSMGWRIFFSQGQINFAESLVGTQERLSYLLQRYMPQFQGSRPLDTVSDYSFLCQLWQSDYIAHDQLRELLTAVTQEALTHALAIPQAQYRVEASVPVEPILLCKSLWDLVLPIEQTINQWTLLSPDIPSPLSRPHIANWDRFVEYADYVTEQLPHIEQLTHALGQDQCLYQLAHTLSMKVADLAVSLHPLIKLGALGIRPYHLGEALIRPRVACINHSKLTQRYVGQVLEPSGYEVMHLSDSIRALPALLKRPPMLAIMDAELPHLDGYQLCRMIHRREALRDLPVIILAAKGGIRDALRTRLSGAMACLSKPFHHQALLALVQQATATLPIEQQQKLHSLSLLDTQVTPESLIQT